MKYHYFGLLAFSSFFTLSAMASSPSPKNLECAVLYYQEAKDSFSKLKEKAKAYQQAAGIDPDQDNRIQYYETATHYYLQAIQHRNQYQTLAQLFTIDTENADSVNKLEQQYQTVFENAFKGNFKTLAETTQKISSCPSIWNQSAEASEEPGKIDAHFRAQVEETFRHDQIQKELDERQIAQRLNRG